MSRARIGEERTISLTLPETVWEDIDGMCRTRAVSRSAFMREAVMTYFKHLNPSYAPLEASRAAPATNSTQSEMKMPQHQTRHHQKRKKRR